ncbi:hypothetical protein KAR48_17000 [bacterium]|nr:hypothetical protein [bacterium]
MTEYSKDRGRRDGHSFNRGPQLDDSIKTWIDKAEHHLVDSLEYFSIPGLNPFHRKQVYRYFERTPEYAVKAYRVDEDVTLRIYPVGALKRLAEQRTQEVVMNGHVQSLPVMGSFERFVIHDYLKDREGICTESSGESGRDRHIEIRPVFGRTNKKARKKRLMR